MKQYLELLLDLQEIDLQIREHNNQIGKKLKEKDKLDQDWLAFQQGLERLKAHLEESQKQRRKYERDLEVKEAEVKKYKSQMLNVKTNREYQSLLHEIDKTKGDSEQLEEEILKLMEESDGLQQEIKDYQQKLKEEQRRVEEQKQTLQASTDKHQQEEHSSQQQREQLKQGLESRLLAEYEKLMNNKGGVALRLAKDGICQGCFIHLTPQTYEEIKKRDKIYHCPNCLRMLYTEGS